MSEEVSWFARQYIDYVYVPGFLLILGTAIVKWDWLVFAVPLALVLGGYNVWSFRKFFFFCPARIPKHAITPLRRRNLFPRRVLSETKDA